MNRSHSYKSSFVYKVEQEMKIMKIVFWIMFSFTALFIVGVLALKIYIGIAVYNKISETDNVPAAIGKMVGEFEKAKNEASK